MVYVSLDRLDTDCYNFPGGSPNTLVTSGCAYAESSTGWSRTDTFTVLANKTVKGVNYGKSVLMLSTAAPTTSLIDTNGDTVGDEATIPNQCTGGLAFPAVLESTNRTPQTDDALSGKNTGLTADADGAGVKGHVRCQGRRLGRRRLHGLGRAGQELLRHVPGLRDGPRPRPGPVQPERL